jgi:hypothetical protein
MNRRTESEVKQGVWAERGARNGRGRRALVREGRGLRQETEGGQGHGERQEEQADWASSGAAKLSRGTGSIKGEW